MAISRIKSTFRGQGLSWTVLAAALLGVVLFQALPGPRPLDDAYITYRYARSIRDGLGFVYNLHEHVQGTTTPLYTLLLALLAMPLGADRLPLISFGIALIADIANTWLMFRVARALLKNDLAAFAAAMVFLLQPLRLNVAGGGMETSLFITLLLGMYDCYLSGRKVYVAAIFGALAIFTRIDAIFAVGPVFLHAAWKYRATAWKAALLAASLLAPWFIWANVYFGSPIPHSILAKMAAYQTASISSSLIFLLTFLGTGTVGPYRQLLVVFPGLVAALFLVILGLKWAVTHNRESLVVIAYPFVYYGVMSAQHAPLFFSWYYLPLMPGFIVLFFSAFLELSGSLPRLHRATTQVLMMSLAGLMLVVIPAVLMALLPGWADSRHVESVYRQACAQIARQDWSGKTVLAPDIGVVGWELDQASILDPVGLVSPLSLRYLAKRDETGLVSLALLQDQKPDYLITRDQFIKNLLNDPQFLKDYQKVWQKEIPPDGGLNQLESNSGLVMVWARKQANAQEE